MGRAGARSGDGGDRYGRWMGRVAALVVTAMLAFGCSSGPGEVLTESDPTTTLAPTTFAPSTSPATTAPVTVTVVAQGVLRVSSLQLDCCYIEGSCGELEVVDSDRQPIGEPVTLGRVTRVDDGRVIEDESTQFVGSFPDVAVPGGEYVVVMSVYGSEGFCDAEAAEGDRMVNHRCTTIVNVEAGELLELGVAWSITESCQHFGLADEVLP